MVPKYNTCLGLMSKTIKSNPNDKIGSYTENINFIFKLKMIVKNMIFCSFLIKISSRRFFRNTFRWRRKKKVIFNIWRKNTWLVSKCLFILLLINWIKRHSWCLNSLMKKWFLIRSVLKSSTSLCRIQRINFLLKNVLRILWINLIRF